MSLSSSRSVVGIILIILPIALLQTKTKPDLSSKNILTKATVHIHKITAFVWKTVSVSTTDLLRLIKTTAWIKHNNISKDWIPGEWNRVGQVGQVGRTRIRQGRPWGSGFGRDGRRSARTYQAYFESNQLSDNEQCFWDWYILHKNITIEKLADKIILG